MKRERERDTPIAMAPKNSIWAHSVKLCIYLLPGTINSLNQLLLVYFLELPIIYHELKKNTNNFKNEFKNATIFVENEEYKIWLKK